MTVNSVRTDLAALEAHHELVGHSRKLDDSLAKAASGLAINHPREDAAKFVFSEQLRTEISDAKQAEKNTATAISMVQSAESGLAEINNLLTHMRQVLVHAANDATLDEFARAADQSEIDNSIQELDLILANLHFGKRPLYKRSSGANGTVDSDHLDFIKASKKTVSSGIDGYPVKLTGLPARTNFTLLREFNEEELEVGNVKLTFIMGGQKLEYVTKPSQTSQQLFSDLNAFLNSSGFDLYATTDKKNIITFQHKDFGSRHSFQIASDAPGLLQKSDDQKAVVVTANLGQDAEGTIGGELFIADGLDIYGKKGGRTEGLQLKLAMPNQILPSTKFDLQGNPFNEGADFFLFNEELPQAIGRVLVDNQSLTYHVGTEYQEIANFHIPEMNSKTIGRNIENKSGIESLNEVSVVDFDRAQDSLLVLDAAVNEITALRGDIGAFQRNLLEPNQVALAEKLGDIISAESKIRDADMAETTADLVKHRLSQSVATDVLKNAHQRKSEVLRLFRG